MSKQGVRSFFLSTAKKSKKYKVNKHNSARI
uniref:Uncharacterized protein n=1 Tax=Arundo donax TaxID=35708 RepID=A0A0A9EY16_ARUDO